MSWLAFIPSELLALLGGLVTLLIGLLTGRSLARKGQKVKAAEAKAKTLEGILDADVSTGDPAVDDQWLRDRGQRKRSVRTNLGRKN